ncbi:DUF421 domain-containing protein [Epilithonimonas hungarica]|uniref:YetF C-terminal domain-containing protein n=1 Tax=Epilithonimonas hungarica TaxID=454006 RepID=A0A1G7SUM8_9FLAO|nr:YetF domain-containing protein [Epilithonimonas hungarica]SDG26681.1 Protein of unknown function [Epilithonimonas hungarica]
MNPILDIVVRSLAVYFFMVIAVRVFGKNQLSQLNAGDVILLLLISNAVQNAMVGSNSSLQGGIVAALVLFVANFVVKKFIFKNQKIKELIEDHPYILVKDGVVYSEILRKVQISEDELEEAVHEHGIEKVSDVKLAILEVDGNISVISTDNNTEQTHYSRHKTKMKRKFRNQ